MRTTPATQLAETVLYRRLVELRDQNGQTALAGNVLDICREAADRLRIFPALHRQFTLHDEIHCLRVVVLMGELSRSCLYRLNEIEIALLILAAYMHDQGMIVDGEEIQALSQSEDWQTHTAQWASDHPNRAELNQRLLDPYLVGPERERVLRSIADLDAGVFTDFVRRQHGDRAAAFVMNRYGADPRLVTNGRSLANLLALICRSHVLSAESIIPANGFYLDELVGMDSVNTAFVATILRLADILDFDRDRTPDHLYRAIDFTSGVSLLEWEKHRSVVGWTIDPDRIAFAAECEHPAYERAIRQFVTWIDEELTAAREWSRRLPAEYDAYRIAAPSRVDISRVGARIDIVTGRPCYIYFDLEFSLARDELVKLLMTDQLYSSTSLFVRELLQNALDALRHRQALFAAEGGIPPELKISLEHYQDSAGYEVVRCSDTGVGMDTGIIAKFLTRAGKSYYRSPDFERERARFQSRGCDFDPCARFGIGFLSCFMFGDDITVYTRRDRGMALGHGDPLIVKITGLSSIVAVRPGAPDQEVGTTIEVRGRKKSFVVDEYDDLVHLTDVVRGYALATEFPIVAECLVPGIVDRAEIPMTFASHPHPLENLEIGKKRVFVVDLAEIHANLRGQMRLCTLVDSDNHVATINNEAEIVVRRENTVPNRPAAVEVQTRGGVTLPFEHRHEGQQVCVDGILVAGEPGRGERSDWLGYRSAPLHYNGASYIIDARGTLKPELTAARTPPDRIFGRNPGWQRLSDLAARACGRLLSEVLSACPDTDPERFWAVAEAYTLDVATLPLPEVWNSLRLPVRRDGGVVRWTSLAELRDARLVYSPGSEKRGAFSQLVLAGGDELYVPDSVGRFRRSTEGTISHWLFESLICATSVIDIMSPTELRLTPSFPSSSHSLRDLEFGDGPSWLRLRVFGETASRIVRVVDDAGIANAANSVVLRVRDQYGRRKEEYSSLDLFLQTLVWAWPRTPSDHPAQPDSWTQRTRMRLGQLSRGIDWSTVPIDMRPPYAAFLPGYGIVTVTHAHLKEWGA